MLRSIKQNLKALLISSSISGRAVVGYFYYLAYRNRTNFEKMANDDNMKDTTRDTYEFYGINWGFASDSMV